MTSSTKKLIRIALDQLATVVLVMIIISLRYGNDPASWVFTTLTVVSAGWIAANSAARFYEEDVL
jgi:hypothetical protein